MTTTVTVTINALALGSCPIGCRDFNGSTDRISWNNSPMDIDIWIAAGDPITISAWVYVDNIINLFAMDVFNISSGSNNDECITLQLPSSASIKFIRLGETPLYKTNSCGSLAGGWHHIAVTHDGDFADYTHAKIYVDGVLRITGESGSNGDGEVDTGNILSLGGYSIDGHNLDGKICQVGVWNKVLTAGDVTNLAAGYSPYYIENANLVYYFEGNTTSLWADPPDLNGQADGTTWLPIGPDIIYEAP